MKLQYPTHVKDTNHDVYIKVFKKAIKANGETTEVNIINLFGFILKDNISKWGKNYVQNHPNCTFEELEQTFCKQLKTIKNNEKVSMQFQNIQQQTTKCVEVHYEHLLKLANCLQVRGTYVFFTTIFKVGLLLYLRLTTTGMKRGTLIEHKEVAIMFEENELVSLNYNVLLTTPKANTIIKHVVHVVIAKSTLTYINYGKTSHSLKTYHNRKKKVQVVPTTTLSL
jgi:hypothetical protein